MKEITEVLLAEIEEYAGLMFSKQEIAAIVEVPEEEFCDLLSDKNTPVWKAFQRGRLIKEGTVRKSIFDLASNGSSPAQSFAVKLIDNAKMDDL